MDSRVKSTGYRSIPATAEQGALRGSSRSDLWASTVPYVAAYTLQGHWTTRGGSVQRYACQRHHSCRTLLKTNIHRVLCRGHTLTHCHERVGRLCPCPRLKSTHSKKPGLFFLWKGLQDEMLWYKAPRPRAKHEKAVQRSVMNAVSVFILCCLPCGTVCRAGCTRVLHGPWLTHGHGMR